MVQAMAQSSYSSDLIWEEGKYLNSASYKDKEDVLRWTKSFGNRAPVVYEEIRIVDKNYLICEYDPCSGVYCPHILIFRHEDDGWRLFLHTRATLKGKIEFQHPINTDLLIFATKHQVLDTLHVDVLK
jgi:hypothetical protein